MAALGSHLRGKILSLWASDMWPHHLLRKRVPEVIFMSKQNDDYTAYINNSLHWKELRQQKFREVGKRCEKCANHGFGEMHCHHINYKNLTDCLTSDLLVLCSGCHDKIHCALRMKRAKTSDYGHDESLLLIQWYEGLPESQKVAPKRRIKRKKFKAKSPMRAVHRSIRRDINRCISGAISVRVLTRLQEVVAVAIKDLEMFQQESSCAICHGAGCEHQAWCPQAPEIIEHQIGDGPIPESSISMQLLESLMTENGGYTRATLARLGVAWPPRGKWLRRLKRVARANDSRSVVNLSV